MTDKYSDLKKAAEACDRFEEVSSENIEVWDKLGGYREASATERDFLDMANPATVLALIAENERVDSAWHDMKRELDHLKAEAESLRKDAERYRWFRNSGDPDIAYLDFRGHIDPEALDEEIDAAMNQEPQS